MSTFFNNISSIPTNVIEYVSLQKDLLKFQFMEKSTNLLTRVISSLILVVLGLIVILFLTIAGALAINESMSSSYIGFLIMAGVYALVGLLVYLTGRVFIANKIANIITSILLENEK